MCVIYITSIYNGYGKGTFEASLGQEIVVFFLKELNEDQVLSLYCL